MLVGYFVLVAILHLLAVTHPMPQFNAQDTHTADTLILLVFPVTMATAYVLALIDRYRSGGWDRLKAIGGVRGLSLAALICSTALTSIGYAIGWYLSPSTNLFEARFTVNATLFATLVFIANKAQIHYLDIFGYLSTLPKSILRQIRQYRVP